MTDQPFIIILDLNKNTKYRDFAINALRVLGKAGNFSINIEARKI